MKSPERCASPLYGSSHEYAMLLLKSCSAYLPMPFTLSHPAAILPLRPLLGRFGVLSALVIGSMAPDFPYFVGKLWPRIYTHTLESVIWFSLPAGWCVYVLFEYILRRPIWFVLPGIFRQRLSPEPQFGGILPVSVCLILGAFTHVTWDAFTHSSGALVRHFPILQLHWATLFDYQIWSYKILQHGSTLLGGLSLMIAIFWWQTHTPACFPLAESTAEKKLRGMGRLLLLLGPIVAGLAIGLLFSPPSLASVRSIARFIAYVVISGLSTTLLLLGFLSLRLSLRQDTVQDT